MTERKVLNKYFPPDYDPAKIPRMRRGHGRRQFNIRTMAPFNMRCTTCNGYIYKAKKFNSRMETAENVDYLGLRHYRFYIRCPSCCAEIIWRTDLESQDYVLESGAKRNFEALKTAEELEAKKLVEEEEELANNPMKMLEKRTDQSKQEMEMVEVIEDLKQVNKRLAGMETEQVALRQIWQEQEAQQKAAEEADEALIKELLASRNSDILAEDVPSESIRVEESVTIVNPVEPIKSKSMKTHAKAPTNSYMKRQLHGSVLIKNSTTAQVATNSTFHPPTKELSHDPPEPKQARITPCQLPTSSNAPVLPGMTYSDHSDSD